MMNPTSRSSVAVCLISWPSGTIEDCVRGMGAGPNIRGALVGRNVLFAGEDDPAAIAEAINLVVHERASAIDAMSKARAVRGTKMDLCN